jgi:hypothetical protein
MMSKSAVRGFIADFLFQFAEMFFNHRLNRFGPYLTRLFTGMAEVAQLPLILPSYRQTFHGCSCPFTKIIRFFPGQQ